ncbi:MAG: cyclic nucleotide-binding domain-containing protein [Gammaproteobacteria bacterium]|nr:cyclic nucleotide-binding domain-containing protein [Gammaproteobacteria bacterium]MCP5137752.1 cyclic nucleotide-binding domain-containing protein [Gammaproteobacteria bacterium]
MSSDVSCDAIRGSSLGRELTGEECEVLSGVMRARDLDDGDVLVTHGQEDTTLFLLVFGHIAVVSDDDGEEKTVYRMKPGEIAGTRAFVDRVPRKATLKSVGASRVYCMQPDDFEQLIDSHPHVVYKVMRALFCITHSNLMRMNVESHHLANYITRGGRR